MYPARPHAAEIFPGVIFAASIAAQSTMNGSSMRCNSSNSAGDTMWYLSSSFSSFVLVLEFLCFEDEDENEDEEDFTRASTVASPNSTGTQRFKTARSRSARRQISGPMPAGSPIVKPNTGRALFIFRSANAIRSYDAASSLAPFP